MGREIRRVPPNWSHPTQWVKRWVRGAGYRLELAFRPLLDGDYAAAVAEWEEEKARWDAGQRPDWAGPNDTLEEEYGERPKPEDYRPYSLEEATWYQLFETVSEGSPVSPPFATLDELAAYLAENGDVWDQARAIEEDFPIRGWGRERADAFCRAGWAPSMIIRDGELLTNPGDMVSA